MDAAARSAPQAAVPAASPLAHLRKAHREGRLLPADLASARILVVDDDPDSLLLLRDIFGGAGFTGAVFTSESSEVVPQFEDSPPDLLVLDLMMPSPDGYELMQMLTRWTTGESYVPILALTADTSQAARLRALDLGARDFLAKPLDPIEVTLRIRNLLATRKLQISLQRHTAALAEQVRERERQLQRARRETSRTDDLDHVALLRDVRRALDRGELCLHYQPIATTRELNVLGVEAFLRWEHPLLGSIEPAAFLPVVEASDLSWRVDCYVLEQAIAQAKEWQQRGLTLPIAVNVTSATISDTRLPREFARLVKERDVDPDRIGIEVTEGAVMTDPRTAAAILHRLGDAGLGSAAVDDFGTGHSSLARMHELSFDRLKIDRSFVARMDESGTTVISGIIALGKSLGMLVVAEGVESEDSWRVLRDLGCDAFQGYWLARPQPADELERWLAAFGPDRALLAGAADSVSATRAHHRADLRESYFQTAFNAMTDVVLILDDDRQLVDCNEAACRLFGLEREQLLQARLQDFRPPELLPELDDMWRRFLAAGESCGYEPLKLPDSRTVWVEFRRTANFVPGHHISVMRPLSEGRASDDLVAAASRKAYSYRIR